LIAALLVLVGATPASAAITGSPDALAMVALMAVPKPDAQVFIEPCPGYEEVAGCAFPDGRIYVPDEWGGRTTRGIVYHELGHRYATPQLLRRFRRITGMQRRSGWLVGERFADAYANCALDALPGSWRWLDGYDYNPPRKVQRRVCRAIWLAWDH
jgi:hypothetical protein